MSRKSLHDIIFLATVHGEELLRNLVHLHCQTLPKGCSRVKQQRPYLLHKIFPGIFICANPYARIKLVKQSSSRWNVSLKNL
jgi:hypothetical protein